MLGFPLVTVVLASTRSHTDLSTALSSYLLLVVVVAATGGVWPGLLAALAGFLLSNYYFAPPVHTFTIGNARRHPGPPDLPGDRRCGQRAGRPRAADGLGRPGALRCPDARPGGRPTGLARGQPAARACSTSSSSPSTRSPRPSCVRPTPHRTAPCGLDDRGLGGRRHPPATPSRVARHPAHRVRGPGPRGPGSPPRTGTCWPPSPLSWPPPWRATGSTPRRPRPTRWPGPTSCAPPCWPP